MLGLLSAHSWLMESEQEPRWLPSCSQLPLLPLLPSPQPSLFGEGCPSPEGAIPCDQTLWSHLDIDARYQLVLIDELVANHLWEETAGEALPRGSAGRQPAAPMPTWMVVPQWVRGKWKTTKDPVSWVGEQPVGA